MTDLKDMTVNQRVKHFRKLLQFTQTNMAERLGIKCSTYSQLERKGNITCERLIEISKILNINIFVLLFGESPTQAHQAMTHILDELEEYKERYSFLNNVNSQELNYIKSICYLNKSNRHEIYKKAIALHKQKSHPDI